MEFFPDGTKIEDWFYDLDTPELGDFEDVSDITLYGAKPDGKVYTEAIQKLIDETAENGGVVYVPRGTYMTGALFFKPGVHLYLAEGAILKGSDDVADYQVLDTRIEGECCKYLPALINADHCDGFTIFGSGTIDGNGERCWKAFAARRKWNPACTNKDEQRARLVFVSASRNVRIQGVTLQNSQFWTSHFYRCDHIKITDCRFLSPVAPIKAPSTDAIDLDVCSDVLIKGCYMAVNDDSTVLKGGKGTCADTDPQNGSNERILIEDCSYGYCHGILTCGSESVHNRNILMRRIKVSEARNFLWLKMRPDTRQTYEYMEIKDAEIGDVNSLLCIHPWSQFAEASEILKSKATHINLENIKAKTAIFLDVEPNEDQYGLADFHMENMDIEAVEAGDDGKDYVKFTNVKVTKIQSNERPISLSQPD